VREGKIKVRIAKPFASGKRASGKRARDTKKGLLKRCILPYTTYRLITIFPPMKIFSRLFLFTALAFTVLFLTGCPPTASDWRQCRFVVTDVQFKGLRESQAEWSVVVSAVNPTRKVLKIEGLQLTARLEGDTLGKLGNAQPIALAPHDTTKIELNLLMPPKAWNKALKQMQRGGSSEVLITGDVFVKTWFGTHKVTNAINKKYTVDLAELMGTMGGDLLRNLFFR
jgi:LEA14-like dessication related protein